MKLPTLNARPDSDAPPFTGVGALHLRSADLDRSVKFWGGVLGLLLVRTEPAPRRYFFALGPTLIAIEEAEAAVGNTGAVLHLDLSLPDLDALESLRQRLLANGMPTSGLENHDYAVLFRFRDPSTSLLVQAMAPGRALGPEDRTGDPEPTPTARALLSR